MRPQLPKELRPLYRSKLEQQYAAYLEALRLTHEIERWEYEPEKFILAYDCRYTPDWRVHLWNGLYEYHATTGYLRDDANVKLKVFAELVWPHEVYSVRRIKGQWVKKLVKTRQGTAHRKRTRRVVTGGPQN